MNVEEFCDVKDNFPDVFCVFWQLKKRVHLLRVHHIAIMIHKLDDAITKGFKYEALDDVALIEGIFGREGFEATKTGADLKELSHELLDIWYVIAT